MKSNWPCRGPRVVQVLSRERRGERRKREESEREREKRKDRTSHPNVIGDTLWILHNFI
jgi:hypothetical protein